MKATFNIQPNELFQKGKNKIQKASHFPNTDRPGPQPTIPNTFVPTFDFCKVFPFSKKKPCTSASRAEETGRSNFSVILSRLCVPPPEGWASLGRWPGLIQAEKSRRRSRHRVSQTKGGKTRTFFFWEKTLRTAKKRNFFVGN